jgi:uncharacterized membrane protein
MNSLGRGVLGSDFGLLLDLTIFFVIVIPLILIVLLIVEATRDE